MYDHLHAYMQLKRAWLQSSVLPFLCPDVRTSASSEKVLYFMMVCTTVVCLHVHVTYHC